MSQTSQCWCGSTDLVPFGPDYLLCEDCQSLVIANIPPENISKVVDEENDFYGREYSLSLPAREFGDPNVIDRSRTDLSERCLWWLDSVLKYLLPPAKTLELGCGHGGFVALMRQAGYEATGLELSPWLVDFARKTFDVPMLRGPIEQQHIEADSVDAIVLMDVLEHLTNPGETIRRCSQILKPNGRLFIQTPKYVRGTTYAEMLKSDSPFLKLLIPRTGHVHLFSESSIHEFLSRLEFRHIAFEPAIFGHYDMFVVAGKVKMRRYSKKRIDSSLASTPHGKITLASLDMYTSVHEINKRLIRLEKDRNIGQRNIGKLGALLKELEKDREAKLAAIKTLEKGLRAMESIRQSRAYRMLRRIGRWRRQERLIGQALQTQLNDQASDHEGAPARKDCSDVVRQVRRVAVDVVPLLPGGENGGVKQLAVTLIRGLSTIAPDCEFVLLTSARSHDELAVLDCDNVRRVCIVGKTGGPSTSGNRGAATRTVIKGAVKAMLPNPVFSLVRKAYRCVIGKIELSRLRDRDGILREIGADLLFCPFTRPSVHDPIVPIVAVVADLQYLRYPKNFSRHDLAERDGNFRVACNLSERIVCISDFVRQTVLENTQLSPERVRRVYISVYDQLQSPSGDQTENTLKRLGLKAGRFLLYPANFWPHKNQTMLLTAFGMYRSRHPESDLKLVCSGSPGKGLENFRIAVEKMKLDHAVIAPGFLPEQELAALLGSCLALIFPSLYEGFGIPVLEAMAFETPVLCSNVTSLPEVAGHAALYFDPRNPAEILKSIETIETDPQMLKDLVRRGNRRIAEFGRSDQMAKEYLDIFNEALNGRRSFPLALSGIYSDGWTSDRLVVTYGDTSRGAYLEMVFALPQHAPFASVSAQLIGGDGRTMAKPFVIARGVERRMRHALPAGNDFVEITIDPVFQPSAEQMGEDTRLLGCICKSGRIITKNGSINIL